MPEDEIDRNEFDSEWYLETYPDVSESGLDPYEFHIKYGQILKRETRLRPKLLKNIVLVVTDMSTIGGVPNRTRLVVTHTTDRKINFCAFTLKNEFSKQYDRVFCWDDTPDLLRKALSEFSARDTVFVVSNNMLKPFPKDIVASIYKFPIVYFSAGQLAFFVKNSPILSDLDYVKNFKAMKIISLSDGDINFQRQLGIFGQVKGNFPVEQRSSNTYDNSINQKLGFVGRIDFNAKDCMKLLDVGRQMKGSNWPPISIFTTDGRNSPEYTIFRDEIKKAGLEEQFEFKVNCSNKEEIYKEIAFLLLPSKMEGFGNVVVEAFSFGIPVIATSYAPGPAETIEHGKSGFLLDEYSGSAVRYLVENTTVEQRQEMSKHAFNRHKDFSIVKHVEFLEQVCSEALNEFDGQNTHQVFPILKVAELGARSSKK